MARSIHDIIEVAFACHSQTIKLFENELCQWIRKQCHGACVKVHESKCMSFYLALLRAESLHNIVSDP